MLSSVVVFFAGHSTLARQGAGRAFPESRIRALLGPSFSRVPAGTFAGGHCGQLNYSGQVRVQANFRCLKFSASSRIE